MELTLGAGPEESLERMTESGLLHVYQNNYDQTVLIEMLKQVKQYVETNALDLISHMTLINGNLRISPVK